MWGKIRISNHVCVLPSFGRGSFLRFPWNGIQASSCWDNRFNKMLINQEQNNTKPTKVSRIFKFSRDSGRCETNICLSSSLKFSPKIPKKNWRSFPSAFLSMLSGRRDLSPTWTAKSRDETIGTRHPFGLGIQRSAWLSAPWKSWNGGGLGTWDWWNLCMFTGIPQKDAEVSRPSTRPEGKDQTWGRFGSDWTNKRCHKNGPKWSTNIPWSSHPWLSLFNHLKPHQTTIKPGKPGKRSHSFGWLLNPENHGCFVFSMVVVYGCGYNPINNQYYDRLITSLLAIIIDNIPLFHMVVVYGCFLMVMPITYSNNSQYMKGRLIKIWWV